MAIEFDKYQGAGNDFIIINNLTAKIRLSQQEISTMCDRRFGIGADGLILLEKCKGFDYFMRFYNSDGCTASMCGNGGRCIAQYAYDKGISGKKQHFCASDGEHYAEILDYGVKIKMIDVEQITRYEDGCFVNTGVPHFVVFVNDIDKIDIRNTGRKYADDKRFSPERSNIDFCDFSSSYRLATYERGVEDETLACGTGAVATALSINTLKGISSPILIKAKGGDLMIYFNRENNNYTNIWLEGPAQKVFNGYLYDKL